MLRNKKPYYLYKDTAYSRLSPFKPEWIEELLVVDNNDPESNEIIFNNGHFHSFEVSSQSLRVIFMIYKKLPSIRDQFQLSS